MQQCQKELQKHFDKMVKLGPLFIIEVPKLWDMYLASFKDDPIFRDPNSSVHNCNLCNDFIRRYGNIVTIDPKTK